MKWCIYMAVFMSLGLAACGQDKPSDVWTNYDVRHPVPADSTVPDSYARQYDAYRRRDNDSYYAPIHCAGFDQPGCIGGE